MPESSSAPTPTPRTSPGQERAGKPQRIAWTPELVNLLHDCESCLNLKDAAKFSEKAYIESLSIQHTKGWALSAKQITLLKRIHKQRVLCIFEERSR